MLAFASLRRVIKRPTGRLEARKHGLTLFQLLEPDDAPPFAASSRTRLLLKIGKAAGWHWNRGCFQTSLWWGGLLDLKD